jgi:hypothetical protein
MRPLSWNDADSGALFRPGIGRVCEPCPTLAIGFMIGMMRPLSWDDADSGAPTIERVDRICESRPGLMAGLMVGLMVEVMRPLGWAFTGHLTLDPSLRWLALSPARDAPGRDSARWLISRTGSGRRQFDGQPGELPRWSQGHPEGISRSRRSEPTVLRPPRPRPRRRQRGAWPRRCQWSPG